MKLKFMEGSTGKWLKRIIIIFLIVGLLAFGAYKLIFNKNNNVENRLFACFLLCAFLYATTRAAVRQYADDFAPAHSIPTRIPLNFDECVLSEAL